jgi:hypothetical protein
MTTSERIKNYLVTTKDLYVKLGGLGAIKIFRYSDAAYITDGNAKSRLGGCAFMGLDAGAVLSFSRNDSIMGSLSHSSTEAEIKAVDELMREMIHLLDVSRTRAPAQQIRQILDISIKLNLFEMICCVVQLASLLINDLYGSCLS